MAFLRGPLLSWHVRHRVLHLLMELVVLLILLDVCPLSSSSPLHPLIRHHYRRALVQVSLVCNPLVRDPPQVIQAVHNLTDSSPVCTSYISIEARVRRFPWLYLPNENFPAPLSHRSEGRMNFVNAPTMNYNRINRDHSGQHRDRFSSLLFHESANPSVLMPA